MIDAFGSTNSVQVELINNGEGGGTKKFVTNTTTNTYDAGEKVLVNLGIRPSELSRGFDIKNTSNEIDRSSVFVDNNNVIVHFSNNGRYKYTFENHQWNSLDINSWGGSYPTNSGVCTYKDGTVRLGCVNYTGTINSSTTGILMTSSSLRALPKGYSYMGSYSEKDYAYYSEGNVIKVYDKFANVVSDSVLDLANQTSNAFMGDDGYGFVHDTAGILYFIKANDDGSIVNEKSMSTGYVAGNISSRPTILYTQTGANIGDFLFFVTNYPNCYNNSGYSGTRKQISTLIIYEIVDDGNGVRTIKERPDLFNKFQTENCLIQYDNRNDVLTIGTMDNVYAYKFNRNDKNFEQLGYKFHLVPNTNQNYCYRLAFSPDMSKAIITIRPDYQDMSVSLFTLGNANWEIVDNQVINYNATTSFSAITTGNVDEDGKVEVKLTLPDKIDLVIDTNVEINAGDIVIEGVE